MEFVGRVGLSLCGDYAAEDWQDDGRWKMEDGRWKMEDGRWKMEDGRPKTRW
jgi:hypothetical protein